MLSTVKLLLGITANDRDSLLNYIISATEKRLIILLGLLPVDNTEPTVPTELSHIVADVTCARFNRIASEGMKSDSVEGESITFYDGDFDPYKEEMTAWLGMQSEAVAGGKGKVRFI